MKAWMIRAWGSLGVLLVLSACASKPPLSAPSADTTVWQGRMAVHIDSSPPEAFSANFVLQGNANQGSLSLSSALGTTLAELDWSAQHAQLHSQGTSRQFASLHSLLQHATGADLPVHALFAWLRGEPLAVPGWTVDMSRWAQGQLSAHSTQPPAPTRLRIILTD